MSLVITHPPIRAQKFISQTWYDSEWLRESAAGVHYARGHHYGYDGQDYEGAPLSAVCAGTIKHVNFGSALGTRQFVLVPSGSLGGFFYAHCSARLSDGVRVKGGQYVGRMGHSSSYSIATHLHFEELGRWSDWNTPVNPGPQLRALQEKLKHPDSQGEWDDMATKEEIQEVVQSVVQNEIGWLVAALSKLLQEGVKPNRKLPYLQYIDPALAAEHSIKKVREAQ